MTASQFAFFSEVKCAYDLHVSAAIEGLCSNPDFNPYDADDIAFTAAKIAERAIDARVSYECRVRKELAEGGHEEGGAA